MFSGTRKRPAKRIKHFNKFTIQKLALHYLNYYIRGSFGLTLPSRRIAETGCRNTSKL